MNRERIVPLERIIPYDDEHLGFKEAAKELHVSPREIARLIFIGRLPYTREIAFPWNLADIYANRKRIFFLRREIERYKEDPGFWKATRDTNLVNFFRDTVFSSEEIPGASAAQPEIKTSLPNQKGLVFDEEHQCVIIDGIREDLSDEQFSIFRELWKAKGCWRSGAVLHENAAKIKYSMSQRVKEEIESQRRQGYRLKRFLQ